MRAQIEINQERLAEFCRRHHIRKLSFFGSVLREDFRPDSEVDLLVEFAPDHIPGLLRLAGMENELTDMVGREVELRTAEDLSRYFRDEVVSSAELVYAA